MKELSIEEKAKAYDEALKVANKYKDTHIMFPSIKDEMFPELKESEDERIRKSLIGHLKECRNNTRSEVMLGEYAKWIAWLEEQGEQKPADKVEPKFKVGDWVICRNGEDALYQITDSIPTGYMIKGDDGIIHSVTFEQLVNCNATLCVIQNQKPSCSDETNAKRMFIKALERVEEQNNKGYKLTDCDKNYWWEYFKAYTSCIIEQNPTNEVGNYDHKEVLQTIINEQNSAWSEEDENECNHILKILNLVAEEQEAKGYNNLINSVNWFKSLKERIKTKQENCK